MTAVIDIRVFHLRLFFFMVYSTLPFNELMGVVSCDRHLYVCYLIFLSLLCWKGHHIYSTTICWSEIQICDSFVPKHAR